MPNIILILDKINKLIQVFSSAFGVEDYCKSVAIHIKKSTKLYMKVFVYSLEDNIKTHQIIKSHDYKMILFLRSLILEPTDLVTNKKIHRRDINYDVLEKLNELYSKYSESNSFKIKENKL